MRELRSRGRAREPATGTRRRLVEWSAGSLDLVEVLDTATSSRHYLVRGPATKALRRDLVARSDRHRVMAAATTYLTSHGVDDLLTDDRHRSERSAAHRQGMPVHSRRTTIALGVVLLLPLILGLIASVLAYWWEWAFFGRRLLDAVFAFPMTTGATFAALSPMFKVLDRWTRLDEQESAAWLDEHAVGLMSGRMLVPTDPSPAEDLEETGAVLELPHGLLPRLEEALADREGPVLLSPVEFADAVWDLAAAVKHAHKTQADYAQALMEVGLSTDQLQEMGLAGDTNAAELLEWLQSQAVAAEDAEESARYRLQEVAALLDAGTDRARRTKVSTALEKLILQQGTATRDARSEQVLAER